MADESAASQRWRVWYWFELHCVQRLYPDHDQQHTDGQLKQHWNRLPRHYMDSLGPALTEVHKAMSDLNLAQTARNNTDIIRLNEWREIEVTQLAMWSHYYASADDRMTVLRRALAAAKDTHSALQALIQARANYKPDDHLSAATRIVLVKLPTEVASTIADFQKEIHDLRPRLPQFRAAERIFKRWKEEGGDPSATGWVGKWKLGSGSFGEANLWVRLDVEGNIFDRLVTKDAKINDYMETEESAWAKHEGQWVPTEVRAPQMMAGQEGSETVIKVRGWRAFEIWDHFRILMEFCPLGDLWDLRLKTYHMSERNSEGHPRMPEPFLWYVFECLAAAGLMMERGTLQQNASLGWEQIYHSDIKLSNIMLREASPNKYRNYPAPVVADFGFAQFCPAGKQCYGRGGTPGNESPENGAPYYLKNGKLIAPSGSLNSKSDVWAVGNVIWSLMIGKEGHECMNFRQNPQPREPPMGGPRGNYSLPLTLLVAEAMKYYAEDRLSFGQLLRKIRLLTGEHHLPAHDNVSGLRSAAANDPKWQQPKFHLDVPADKFPLYSKLRYQPDRAKPPGAAPPHRMRKLSKDVEYKGRISADTRGLSRAGSVRKAVANQTWQEHQRWLQKRRKLKEQKGQGGFRVPDSADDDGQVEEEEIEGLEEPEDKNDVDFDAGNLDWMDVDTPSAHPMRTRAQKKQAQQSRSAAAGAKEQQQGVGEMDVDPSELPPALRLGRPASKGKGKAKAPARGAAAQLPRPRTNRRQPADLDPPHPAPPGRLPRLEFPRQRRSGNARPGAGAGESPLRQARPSAHPLRRMDSALRAELERDRARMRARKEESRRKRN